MKTWSSMYERTNASFINPVISGPLPVAFHADIKFLFYKSSTSPEFKIFGLLEHIPLASTRTTQQCLENLFSIGRTCWFIDARNEPEGTAKRALSSYFLAFNLGTFLFLLYNHTVANVDTTFWILYICR
jgi:hypothetical protein